MPVKYFVSKDSRGKEQPPDFSHEVTAIIEIIKQLYAAFNHHKNLYVIVANLNKHDAMADMVILTERGIGIVELKGYPGQITMRGTEWYAGLKAIPGKPTIAGKSAGYRNPHEQVQLYMDAIRYKLLHPASEPWLPGKYADWVEFQFGTAVCFTHEDVSLDRFPFWHYKKSEKNHHIKNWEQFSILTPDKILGWVSALRFEVTKGALDKYEAYRLTPKQIMRIVTELFEAISWTEIDKQMPTGKPYAYLLIKQAGEEMLQIGLDREKMTIGRDASCDIKIPEQFERVSRTHAQIKRTITGVVVEDCESTNGTYLNGERLIKAKSLEAGQQITLGGIADKEHVCLLEFTFELPEITSTQVGTQVKEEESPQPE